MKAGGHHTGTGIHTRAEAYGPGTAGRAPDHPTGDTAAAAPRRKRLPLLLGCALLVLSVAVYAAVHRHAGGDMADTLVYRAEGMAVLHGHDLYGLRVTQWQLPATYPPFAAILFTPMAFLPVPLLKVAVTAGNVALLAVVACLSLRLARWWPPTVSRPVAVLFATAAGIWLEPVFQTLHFGQINLFILALVLWDLSRPDRSRTKGLAIGIAAGIKLTPGIFAVYLLLTGRIRAALAAAGAFAGTVALGWGLLPDASREFWTRRLFETGRVGEAWIVDNQSLQGLVARLLHTEHPGAPWIVLAAVTAVAGLAVSVRVARAGEEAWGIVCCAVTALLISPISWSHHWVWCVPMLALLAADASRAGRGASRAGRAEESGGAGRGRAGGPVAVAAAVLAVFLARSMWLIPKEGHLDLYLPWWQQPLGSPYPLLGLAFLGYALLRPRIGTRDSGGPGGYGSRSPLPASRSSASTIR